MQPNVPGSGIHAGSEPQPEQFLDLPWEMFGELCRALALRVARDYDPELVVGITAIRKGHPELLVGNVIGADILNVLFVIGFSALAAALPILDFGTPQEPARYPAVFLQLQLPTMLLMLVFVRLCIFKAVRTERFDRWMGVPLVLMYVAFVVVSACLA